MFKTRLYKRYANASRECNAEHVVLNGERGHGRWAHGGDVYDAGDSVIREATFNDHIRPEDDRTLRLFRTRTGDYAFIVRHLHPGACNDAKYASVLFDSEVAAHSYLDTVAARYRNSPHWTEVQP